MHVLRRGEVSRAACSCRGIPAGKQANGTQGVFMAPLLLCVMDPGLVPGLQSPEWHALAVPNSCTCMVGDGPTCIMVALEQTWCSENYMETALYLKAKNKGRQN